jgi:DNA-binding response OmpR family regulator
MPKILLIEDNFDLRKEMAHAMGMEKLNVIEARNGTMGYHIAHEEIPDLILCNVMMPEMNGFDCLRMIKNNKQLASIPFIFISGLAEQSKIDHAVRQGANDYLVKPFTLGQLLAAIKKHLGLPEK